MSIEWSVFEKDAGKGRGGVEITFFTVLKRFSDNQMIGFWKLDYLRTKRFNN